MHRLSIIRPSSQRSPQLQQKLSAHSERQEGPLSYGFALGFGPDLDCWRGKQQVEPCLPACEADIFAVTAQADPARNAQI